MTAALRLVWTYFTATPLMRGLLVLGLACAAAGMPLYLYYPPWTLGNGMRGEALWLQTALLFAPWLGLILLFCASALLPSIVERIAFGRSVAILPGARVAVLISVTATALLISVLTALTGFLAFFYYPVELRPANVFGRTLAVVFCDVSIMYVALWIVGKTRGIWMLIGSLLILVGIVLPLGLIGMPSGLPRYIWFGVAVWLAFAALLWFGGRLRLEPGGAGFAPLRILTRTFGETSYTSGAELALLLGTTRPWVVALGQAVPVVASAWLFASEPRGWLFFLTLLTAISGAITSTAAARCRAVWLRNAWTRAELLQRVESMYWRYNAYPLGVLLLLYVAIGSYLEASTPLLALGVPLLALGSITSLYLGLVMTRGLGWLEAALGILTMGMLMATAFWLVGATPDAVTAIEFELALAGLALLYRGMARARWKALDWMVCRRDPAERAV
jgi:hypothetical protein